jgi:TPR repeat protein
VNRHYLTLLGRKLLLFLLVGWSCISCWAQDSSALKNISPKLKQFLADHPVASTEHPDQAAEFKRLLTLALSGNVQAQRDVAIAYYSGKGVSKDLSEAYRWNLKAANQGDAYAESCIAWDYEHGMAVSIDKTQALFWQRKAAQDGDVDSQVEMGARYQSGRGLPVDLAQAVKWYKKAAVQNNDKGKTALGYALLTGHGIPQDIKSGFTYLLSATDKNAYARFAVARCYADGVFVERDPVEAYRWCLLAMELDQQAAGLATMLKSQLSADQMAQAVKEVADFHRQLEDHNFQTGDLSSVFTGDSAVTIPFEYVLSHILIPVRIANQESEYLMVDTGSGITMLDDEIAAHLKIKGNQYLALGGGTGADSSLTRLARGVEFSLPGLTVSGATAVLSPDFNFDQYLGHPLAGILGYDIMSRLIVSIDYVNKKITFHKPGTYQWDATVEAIPLSNHLNFPFVQASIGSKTDARKGWFLVDTGSGGTVNLTKVFQDANPPIKIEQPVKTKSIGFGGESDSLDGKCPCLILGKIVVSNPIVSLDSQKQGYLQDLMGGYIGKGILERFDETFDSPQGMLFLKPNARFADPFTLNEVGLGIKTEKGDYHSFTVFAIVQDSPAALSNFQVGDQIVGIDKADTATLSLNDIYEIISTEGLHCVKVIRTGVSKELDLKVVKNIK